MTTREILFNNLGCSSLLMINYIFITALIFEKLWVLYYLQFWRTCVKNMLRSHIKNGATQRQLLKFIWF